MVSRSLHKRRGVSIDLAQLGGPLGLSVIRCFSSKRSNEPEQRDTTSDGDADDVESYEATCQPTHHIDYDLIDMKPGEKFDEVIGSRRQRQCDDEEANDIERVQEEARERIHTVPPLVSPYCNARSN